MPPGHADQNYEQKQQKKHKRHFFLAWVLEAEEPCFTKKNNCHYSRILWNHSLQADGTSTCPSISRAAGLLGYGAGKAVQIQGVLFDS